MQKAEGSNPAEGMDIILVQLLCVVRLISRPEESYWMWYVWVWSWSLDREEALAH
jgi:hypothetical protein